MDAARDVDHVVAVVLQKSGHLHAATTVVTQTGHRTVAVDFVQAGGDGVHRHVQQVQVAGLGASLLQFPGFTHVQQHGALFLGAGPGFNLRGGQVLHGVQNSKRVGSTKPFRRGALASQGCAVDQLWSLTRVMMVARMMGSCPTMAIKRPPTLS